MEEVHKALVKQFGKRKAKAAELNWGAAQAGFDYAAKTFTKTDPFRVERMNATAGKIIIDGNAACALGAMFAGVTVVTWYPITPSSSLVETLIGYMKRFRIDPETGKATYAIVQAEDELASIGMALGAGWAGARSMTATAGPGISLMSEFIGLGYYAEDARGDLRRGARRPLHRPAHAHPAGRPAHHRHPLARRHQAPHVLPVLAGRVLHHVDRGLRFRRAVPDAGLRHDRSRSRHEQLDGRSVPVSPRSPSTAARCSTAEDLDRLGGFARYKDVDGDGVGYRTLPGTNHPAGGVLHARQRPQREGPVHRARRRLHPQHGPPGAQVRGHAPARAASRWWTCAEAPEIGFDRRRHFGLRGARKLRPVAAPNTESRPATCA